MNHTASHATPPHTTITMHHHTTCLFRCIAWCILTYCLFSQTNQCVYEEFEGREHKISFIVVGPIDDQSKITTGKPSHHLFKLTYVLCHATVNLLINTFYTTKFIEEGAILLAVRPLQIEHEVTADRYFRYKPSKS